MMSWNELPWELVHMEPQPAALHMALDEIITQQVSEGTRAPTLRIWEWQEAAVVIGRFQSLRNEIEAEAATRHGIRVVRRISGGGAMFIEPGNTITYSLSVPKQFVAGMTFQESYEFLDSWVIEALREIGIDAWYQPLNDITSAGGKIGGAAQARRGNAVLHHVTMAYDIDADKMLEVLRIGKEKLSDKGTTSAKKRVDPIRSQTGMSREAVIEAMLDVFRKKTALKPSTLETSTLEQAEKLARGRFLSNDWTQLVP